MPQTTSNDGTAIGFTRRGSGPALLLVHGSTADHTRWEAFSTRLEPDYTVYAMDRRGRGLSGDAPAYALQREAEDVAAVIAAIGGPVLLLGHSFGSICCLEAARLTTNVSRLVLYEPPMPPAVAEPPAEILSRMERLVASGELEAALEIMFREIVQMPEEELIRYRQLPAWQVRIQLAPTIPREARISRTYSFQPEAYARFPVPTLLLLGEHSPDNFKRATEMVAAALPNSKVVVLPGQQHVAMDMDPDRFEKEVRAFLSAQP